MPLSGKKRARDRYAIQMPLTSLIDIVFLLLVYFLLTTNFITEQGLDVNLPDAEAAASQTREEIALYIDREGLVYVGDQTVEFNQLFDRLKDRIHANPGRLVVVRADGAVNLERAVQVMDIAQAAGAESLFLATEKRD